MRFPTIVADPPWRYGGGRSGVNAGSARHHYPTMDSRAIARLDVPAEDDAYLWLWAVNGLMLDAHEVCEAWGFQPLTILTWCKPGPGVGRYLRNNTEHCILARKGRPPLPETAAMSSWYEWPRSGHSAKPDAFYDLVESLTPGPYLEMFARRARLGDWSYFGNESLGTVELAA